MACNRLMEDKMALSERMRQEQAERARLARMLTTEELAACCGGCRTNSAIETWMRRAITRFCEANSIALTAGVPGRDADTNRHQPPMPDGADR
jgi:hypothetical protein